MTGMRYLRTHATVTTDGVYRYSLMRRWSMGFVDKDNLLFIMLNPSTADALQDDPTIRKCVGFAARGGYCGLRVVNLFAFRATKPIDLWKATDPVGPENDVIIRCEVMSASDVVFAWGANEATPWIARRVETVKRIVQDANKTPLCLGVTKAGYPLHPLMQPYAAGLPSFPGWSAR